MRRVLNHFDVASMRGDFFGGLSAAIVALPLGLAFGVASGAGPMAGVYSAVLLGFFASVFGGTSSQISGPTGPMTVVMTGILTTYMARDPENGLASAFAIVVLAGFFQICFGLLKLGKYVVQVSYPVISGFMSGIGVIIVLLQLRPLFGQPAISAPSQALLDIPNLFTAYDLPTLVLGLGMLALLFGWRGRPNVILPGPVLVLVAGSLVAYLLPGLASVSVLGEIPTGLPVFQLPHFDPLMLMDEIASALLLAALGSIDSLLTSLVADNMTQTHHDSDKELIGQGVGNMVAGFFAALPGAGATVRTVVNIKAGGSSAYAGVFHALIVAFIVLAASGLASHIPHVVLAAILLKVGFDIVDRRFLRRVHRMPLVSSGLMVSVLLMTVFVDLITAVFVGVFIANMITVERLTNLQLDNVRLVDDFDQELRQSGVEPLFEDILLLELKGPMSFAVARGLNRRLAEQGEHKTLVIDLTHAVLLGVTTSLVVLDLIEDEQRRNRTVVLVGVNRKSVSPAFERIGIFDKVPPELRLAQIEEIWSD